MVGSEGWAECIIRFLNDTYLIEASEIAALVVARYQSYPAVDIIHISQASCGVDQLN